MCVCVCVCICVCVFGIQSDRHPIVICMGNLPLWGGGIPTPINTLFTLLESRCFLQVYTTSNIQADIGTQSYMCTCDYHLTRFQHQKILHTYTQTEKEIPSQASNLLEDTYLSSLATRGNITLKEWCENLSINR